MPQAAMPCIQCSKCHQSTIAAILSCFNAASGNALYTIIVGSIVVNGLVYLVSMPQAAMPCIQSVMHNFLCDSTIVLFQCRKRQCPVYNICMICLNDTTHFRVSMPQAAMPCIQFRTWIELLSPIPRKVSMPQAAMPCIQFGSESHLTPKYHWFQCRKRQCPVYNICSSCLSGGTRVGVSMPQAAMPCIQWD